MVVKFNPEGHVTMVFGRKKEASDEAEPWSATSIRRGRRSTGSSASRPTSRGTAGQHLHQRRLHQLARREVRQERRLGEVVRRAGQRSGPAEHAAQHRRPTRRATSTSPIAATAASRCSTATASSCARSRSTCRCRRTRRPAIGNRRRANREAVRGTMGPGAPWAICITPGPNQVLYAADAFPGRIYKLIARRQGARRARQGRASS